MSELVNYQTYGPLYAGWARLVSFLLASGLSVALLAMPHLVASDLRELDDSELDSIGFRKLDKKRLKTALEHEEE